MSCLSFISQVEDNTNYRIRISMKIEIERTTCTQTSSQINTHPWKCIFNWWWYI